VLVVLDCCHSGSGTRAPLEDGIGSRRAPTDTRERPLSSFLFDPARVDEIAEAQGPERSVLGNSGWTVARAKHVLLSGCRANETSKEIVHRGAPRGAMSAALETALSTSGDALTYREIHRQVSATVRNLVRQQSPQLETSSASDLDQPFLGGAVTALSSWFVVTHEGSGWTMDGGLVHGVGAPIHDEVTKVAVTDPADATTVAATADVTQVRAGDSTLQVTAGDLDPSRSYRATLTSTPLPPLLIQITGPAGPDGPDLSGGGGGAVQEPAGGTADRADALRTALAARDEHGPLLVAEAEPGEDPQIRVVVEPDGYAVTRRGSERELCPRPRTATDAVAVLEHVAAWSSAHELRNGASQLPRDAIAVTLEVQPDPGQPLPVEVDGVHRLEYLTGDDRSRPRGYTITLKNTTRRTLHVALLDLTDTFGIYTEALEAGSERLDRDGSVVVKLKTDVPDELWEQGVTEVTDVLKLIASTEPFDPRPLEQDDLEVSAPPRREVSTRDGTQDRAPQSSLDRLLNRVATRRARPQSSGEATADWYTRDLTVVSVRPRPGVEVTNNAVAELGAGVRIKPHETLKATVELATAADATRDLSSAPVPGCLQGKGTMPFALTTTRDGAQAADALLVHLDPQSPPDAVTPEQPFVITVEQALVPGEHLLPFAWDGEFYIPLGHARPSASGAGTDIVIERLAEPVATERSLGGSIRILVRKLVGNAFSLPPKYPLLRLARAAADGTVSYEADRVAVAKAVEAADSVLLYVHGIIGDTEGMARSSRLSGDSPAVGGGFDAVLTFDYENLDTPIEENAASLAAMLGAVGLGGHHGKRFDIVAHSMGGLVARHMIERIGGVDVDRLITLGTPNGGSPWPSVQRWATAAIAFAANGLIPVAWPVTALAAVLGTIEKVDTALDQMQPGSGFLAQLANAPDPGTTYHVIVGNRSLVETATEGPSDGRAARLLARLTPSRIGSSIVDLVFLNQPNDLAVSVTSAQGLPLHRDPAPQIHVVASDHVSFFEDRASLDSLAQAVAT
jgi:pimeloyl-ACP methyl ester carboxylesterase